MTDDLASWLLAQIAEDERVARASHPHARWWVDGPAERSGEWWIYDAGTKCKRREDAEHIASHDPARVLRECEAKRRIVERHQPYERAYHNGTTIVSGGQACERCRVEDVNTDDSEPEPWPCLDLRLLALPYADRDGYQDDWRP